MLLFPLKLAVLLFAFLCFLMRAVLMVLVAPLGLWKDADEYWMVWEKHLREIWGALRSFSKP